MPVAPDGQPGVAFRNGWRVAPARYLASHWVDIGWDSWRHDGGPLDIVAFLPSYAPKPMAPWRSVVCTMIRERFPNEIDNRINERLADDLIAFLTAHRSCDKDQPRWDFPEFLNPRQI
jgi:hypothetical protein